jgi:hypothetical protein
MGELGEPVRGVTATKAVRCAYGERPPDGQWKARAISAKRYFTHLPRLEKDEQELEAERGRGLLLMA